MLLKILLLPLALAAPAARKCRASSKGRTHEILSNQAHSGGMSQHGTYAGLAPVFDVSEVLAVEVNARLLLTDAETLTPGTHHSTPADTTDHVDAPLVVIPARHKKRRCKAPGAAVSSSPASSTAATSPSSSQLPTEINNYIVHSTTTDAHKFTAPHNVIYALSSFPEDRFPSAEEMGQFNRLILSFYMTTGDTGYEDSPLVGQWVNMDRSARQRLLDSYHAAGIAVMIAVFGGTDQPTMWGVDPSQSAIKIATFAKEQQFDGVDVDYEDFAAFAQGSAAAWVNTFQTTLRAKLGDDYLISHAPIAPWFDESKYPDGAYSAIWSAVGSGIDFFNVQYYNQGTAYTTCEALIHNATSTSWKGTALAELHTSGIPWEKLVIGKVTVEESAMGGYMTPETLAQCADEAAALGWIKQMMFWQWDPSSVDKAELIATVLGGGKASASSK